VNVEEPNRILELSKILSIYLWKNTCNLSGGHICAKPC